MLFRKPYLIFVACLLLIHAVSLGQKARKQKDKKQQKTTKQQTTQKQLHLDFDEKGRLLSILPDRIDSVDLLDFQIQIPYKKLKEEYERLEKQFALMKEHLRDDKTLLYSVTNSFIKGQATGNLNTLPQTFDADYFLNSFSNTYLKKLEHYPENFKHYYQLYKDIVTLRNVPANPSYKDVLPYSLAINEKPVTNFNIVVNADSSLAILHFIVPNESKRGTLNYVLRKNNVPAHLALEWYTKLIENDTTQRTLAFVERLLKDPPILNGLKSIKGISDTVKFVDENLRSVPHWIQTVVPPLIARYRTDDNTITNYLGNKSLFDSSFVLQKWVIQWMWFTGGKILLNPFDFTTSDRLTKPNSIQQQLIQFDLTTNKRLLDSLRATMNDTAAIRYLRAQYEKNIKDKASQDGLAGTITGNDGKVKSALTTSIFAYKGIVPVSREKGLKYRLQHPVRLRNYYNAEDDLLSDAPEFDFTYPEDEKVVLLYHNVPSNAKVELVGDFKPFDDSPEITRLIIKTIDSGGSILNTVSGALEGLTKLNNLASQFVAARGIPSGVTPIANTPFTLEVANNALKLHGVNFSPLEANAVTSQNNLSFFSQKDLDSLLKSVDTTLRAAVRQAMQRLSPRLDTIALIQQVQTLPPPTTQPTTVVTKKEQQYYQALIDITNSSPLPSGGSLKPITDTVPSFRSQAFRQAKEAPYKFGYSLTRFTKSDTAKSGFIKTKIDSSHYSVGKRHRFQIAAGLAYSLSPIKMITVDTSNGQFNVDEDEDRFRITVGIRYYPFRKGLYLHDNQLFSKEWLTRISFTAAVGIPKPLDNFYLGAGYDLVPGLNINTGVHLYSYRRHEVLNDKLIGTSRSLKGVPYVSLTLDPIAFVKLFQTF